LEEVGFRIIHEDIKPDGKPRLWIVPQARTSDYLGHPTDGIKKKKKKITGGPKLILIKGDMGVVPKLKGNSIE